VSAAITAKKPEQWALGLVLVIPVPDNNYISKKVHSIQDPQEQRMQADMARIFEWVQRHRPDRVSPLDTLRNVEPPVMKLVCCTSLSRIETAARGPDCDHLQCFDLASYIHTMRNIPPKHAWCCPICDKPAPIHRLRLDAFCQSVLDATQPNVTEVLVADNGKWEISAVEEEFEDSSEDEAPMAAHAAHRPPTQADLQQAALNLGRAFSAPAPPQRAAPQHRGSASPPAQASPPGGSQRRSRSPRRAGKDKGKQGKEKEAKAQPAAEEGVDKMHVWEKLQGIAKPEEPQAPVEETRIGWLPEGVECSKCGKNVADKGGVYCGRKRPDKTVCGCFAAICWKCMNKASKDEVGSVRTSKTEFASLGADAWWMHERCMTAEDKKAYFGEDDDEEVGEPKDMDDDSDEGDGKFAWE